VSGCVLGLETRSDAWGFFARVSCEREVGERGLCTRFVQPTESMSVKRGMLPGMHDQIAPRAETKARTLHPGGAARCVDDAGLEAIRPRSGDAFDSSDLHGGLVSVLGFISVVRDNLKRCPGST